ncbi:MAG: DUF1800 domain-containing protein [Saprospiraceae bacterium]|nr:DUF1800 domain-containing protein [Saprospiraceae bacterium]
MDRNEFLSIWRQRRNEQMPSPTASLDPYTGPWTQKQALHLLRRLCFGVKKQDVVKVVGQGLSNALKDLLTLDPTPADPVNIYSTAQLPDPDIAFGKSFVNAPINAALPAEYYQARTDVLKAWWVGNMIRQNPTITEKMTFFWHNHFAVEADTIQIAQAMHQYYKLIHENCLGNFKTLAKLISINPGMLRYLNGYLNSSTAPDENYARELQELFTVGKGPDSKYTEGDVKAAAKILTGYRINPFVMPLSYYFDFSQHDTSIKQFSAFYKNKVIVGKFFAAGEQELDELITMLFDNIETARHICRKLYRFFVYYEIDDTIETNVIHPLADYLKQQNFEIKKVLERLFSSQHFYDIATVGCVIKSPLDYAVGMCREFSIAFPVPVNDATLINQYVSWGAIASLSAYQGLNVGEPPVVAGWQAWYQQPQFHEIWINADSLANRNRVAENVNSPKGIEFLNLSLKIDPTIFAAQMPNPRSAMELVKDSVSFLYNYELSDKSYNYFKSNLISGYPDDSYWTLAWEQFAANPNDPALRNAVTTRLSALYREILSQAEYHLS